jgi:hypothetical protein
MPWISLHCRWCGVEWEIDVEKNVSSGGGTADGAIGVFKALNEEGGGQRTLVGSIVAPIELKGARTDLDYRSASGRKETAVEQGWRYANYTPDCKWIIVSNFREIRLYKTNKTPAYFEQFFLPQLQDLQAFKRFYFLFCRQNLLPVSSNPSFIDALLDQSSDAQQMITKSLYSEYKAVREALIDSFSATTPLQVPDRNQVAIESAQRVLDRVLFIAFSEGRLLLRPRTLKNAHDHLDPYTHTSTWQRYKSVFRWIDKGNADPPISGYNGGLFRHDSLVDEILDVPDSLCTKLLDLTRFDFNSEVSVDVLGHIFEQSVTDIEELKAKAQGTAYDVRQGKRKKEGIFYTPDFITDFIVESALGRYLASRESELRKYFRINQIPARASKKERDAEKAFWEAYRDEVLLKTRVVDPACGSGAFLISAFNYLANQYERVNEGIAALSKFKEQRNLFDTNTTILTQNLFGVDLSPESVEITKLSLWLKTAEKGKTLTYLDDNVKVGNSIIGDGSATIRPFCWTDEFPHVFALGGFDVVIGNPPYVRQEFIAPLKPYLADHYASYNGVADLYTYFYEKGVEIVRPGGWLCFIVANKWLRAGYGKQLRQWLTENACLNSILDFGHAPVFGDADTFPCISLFQKPNGGRTKEDDHCQEVSICTIPRGKLDEINLAQFSQENSYVKPWSSFSGQPWSLEPDDVDAFMRKIRDAGVPLKEFTGVKPCWGIKSGYNDAFWVDTKTKDLLIQADGRAAEVIKPLLRGQDVKRWLPNWQNL